MAESRIPIPDIDVKVNLDVDVKNVNVDEGKIADAGKKAGDAFNEGFNDQVNNNTGATPQVNPPATQPPKKGRRKRAAGGGDDEDAKYEKSQQTAYREMRKAYTEAERSYISLQRSILKGDNKGQDFFTNKQKNAISAYNKQHDRFQKDTTGLTAAQSQWAKLSYSEQRDNSLNVAKAMSSMRSSAVAKAQALVDNVSKKNSEIGGDVIDTEAIDSMTKSLEAMKQADDTESLRKYFDSIKASASDALEIIKKVTKAVEEQEKAEADANAAQEAEQKLQQKIKKEAQVKAEEEEAKEREKQANEILKTERKANNEANKKLAKKFAELESGTVKADTTVNKVNSTIGNKERSGEQISEELQKVKTLADEYGKIRDIGSLDERLSAIRNLEEAWGKYKIAEDAALEQKANGDHVTAMSKGLEEAQKSLEKINEMGVGENNKNWSSSLTEQYNKATDAATKLQEALQAGDTAAATKAYNDMSAALATLSQNFNTVDTAATRMGFSLVENAKQLLGIASPVAIFQGAKSIIKNMANEVTTVNTAMAELRKVTDETEVAYSRFLSNATSTAKEIGSTVSDLINTSSEFARMGYSMSESADLGKTATIFSNVGDFSSVNDASDTLISTMKGFQLSTDMADDIGDKLNAVANKYAVTAADIGEGLQNAASSLNISGNSLDESIAMLTTITEITQDASAAGNALKILSLRLRGASAELENMGESTDGMADSTSKLREQIKALTGFDIMEDDNTFKSTYDQMLGIAKVWDQMSDVSQSALLELIAGKTRSNQVAALLTNMAQAKDILEVSLKSEGSMMEEHERWLDSIEAKQQQLTASFQELSQTVLGSELVAGTYDAGSGLLGLLNNLLSNTGTLAPLLGVLGTMGFSGLTGGNPLAMLFTKGLGDTDKKYIEEFNKIVESMGTANALDEVRKMADDAGDSISSLGNAMMVSSNGMKVMTTGVEGLKSRLKGMGSIVGGFAKTLAANLATTLAVAAAVKLLELAYNTIDRSVNSAKYAEEDWQEKKSELEELQNEKDEVTAELDGVYKQITELQDKLRTKGLTFVEQEELAKLKQTSAELELQNKILAEQVKLKEQAVDEAESATYYTKYGANTSNLYDTYRGQYKRTPTGRRVRVAVSQEKRDYQSAQSYFATVKDYEQIYGGNIEGYFQAKNTLEANEPDENATEDELKKYSDAVSNMQYTTIKMFDTLEGLWGAYEYYNEKGLTNNDVYDNVLSYLDMFKNDEYFAPFFKEMAANYIAEQYKSEFDKLTEGIEKGTITKANIQTSISSGMAALITELFGDIGTWAENILNTYTPETSAAKATSGFTTTSLASRLTEAGEHASLRDNIVAGEPVSTEDYEKLIEYGEDYAACVENINGTLQVNKQRLDEVVASEYAQLNKDIADGLQEEKNALAENIAELAEYTAQLQDTNQDQDDIIRHINTLTDEIDKNKEAIKTYDILAAQIEYATSAYKKWVDAHDGKESGAQYDESFNALEDLREGYESGRVGTNEYKAAQEYLLGANGTYDERTAKILSRYVTEDSAGVENFQADLKKYGYADKTGKLIGNVDLAKIAGSLNISEELVKALFLKANEYIADEDKKYKINNGKYGASDYLRQYADAEQNYNTAYQNWRDNQTSENYQALLTAAQEYNNIAKQLGLGEANLQDKENTNAVSDAAGIVAEASNKVTTAIQTVTTAIENLTAALTENNKGDSADNNSGTGRQNGGVVLDEEPPDEVLYSGSHYVSQKQLIVPVVLDTAQAEEDIKELTETEFPWTLTVEADTDTAKNDVAETTNEQFPWTLSVEADTEKATDAATKLTTETQFPWTLTVEADDDEAKEAVEELTKDADKNISVTLDNGEEAQTTVDSISSDATKTVSVSLSGVDEAQQTLDSLTADETKTVKVTYEPDPRLETAEEDEEGLIYQQSIIPDANGQGITPSSVTQRNTSVIDNEEDVPYEEAPITVKPLIGEDGDIEERYSEAPVSEEPLVVEADTVNVDAKENTQAENDKENKESEELFPWNASLEEDVPVQKEVEINAEDVSVNATSSEDDNETVIDKAKKFAKQYTGEANAYAPEANTTGQTPEIIPLDVQVDSTEADKELNKITATSTKIVNVKFVGESDLHTYASGTDNAKGGVSLVDEEGAEIIQRADGTYEVGTNSGPRLTELNKGDVVYTANETQKILGRKASRNGRRFGLGTDFVAKVKQMMADKLTVSGGEDKDSSKNSPKGKGKSNKIDFDKLIDWIPTLLENLKRKTNDYIRMASKAIGYMLKNANIDSAIDSVKNELDYTEQAYNRYLRQADMVAKQTGLTQDIVDLIQQGAIDITQYSDKVKENIEEYQKWWDKAVDLTDTMDDLNDQLEELALQKLDNITTYFTDIDDLIDANISAMQDAISVKQAYGEELKENDYKPMIEYAEQAVANLTKYQDTLQKEFDALVDAGDIQVGSDAWYEYSTNIRKVSSEIANAKVQVSELNDELGNIAMTNLQTAYEYLQRIQSGIEGVGSLNDAQNVARSVKQYRTLISNGMEQIENLEMQNEELKKQMEGLDILSEKYIELNAQLNDNQEAIMSVKQSQEQWNDAIIDLKIDELQKQNDEFKQRLEIMDAIQEVEDAQQRRVSIYREGQGFVYEADQRELKDAQDNLEEAVNDLIINQLEATKELSNIYDSVGNQLVEVKDMLSGIDFTKYYSSVSAGVEDSTLLKDALSAIDAASIISNLATKDVSIDLSGMTLNNVNSVEELVDAIINQLPGYILQELHSKG